MPPYSFENAETVLSARGPHVSFSSTFSLSVKFVMISIAVMC